jgi:hypothetical protein
MSYHDAVMARLADSAEPQEAETHKRRFCELECNRLIRGSRCLDCRLALNCRAPLPTMPRRSDGRHQSQHPLLGRSDDSPEAMAERDESAAVRKALIGCQISNGASQRFMTICYKDVGGHLASVVGVARIIQHALACLACDTAERRRQSRPDISTGE